ncbi:MAG TPA: efflux RND transporter periplasmic adaptor subunit [Candidatus Brocadiia bacterium]|nr:efflux RND transporter periplasmic adaptor subunit [Candidatus Brocadiia bacterium]
MKKLIVVLLVFGILGVGAWQGYKWRKSKGPKVPPEEVRMEPVEKGKIRIIVPGVGAIEPNLIVEVKSKASGEIIECPYEEGDVVKKGELLAQLDPSDEKRNMDRATTALREIEARLKQAECALQLETANQQHAVTAAKGRLALSEERFKNVELKLKRQQVLAQRSGVVSDEEIETAQNLYNIAKVEIELAKADAAFAESSAPQIEVRKSGIEAIKTEMERARVAIEETSERLADTKVGSPIDGIIVQKFIQTGQIISSGVYNVGGGTMLMLMADVSRLFVLTEVDESDIGKVKMGLPAEITCDAFPDQIFKGEITRIAPRGKVNSGVTIFPVRIELKGENINVLRPMMTSNVAIIIQEKDDVLKVPAEAVKRKKGKEGEKETEETGVVVVSRDYAFNPVEHWIPVKPGITDGEKTEIIGDIEPGKLVLMSMPSWEREAASKVVRFFEDPFDESKKKKK